MMPLVKLLHKSLRRHFYFNVFKFADQFKNKKAILRETPVQRSELIYFSFLKRTVKDACSPLFLFISLLRVGLTARSGSFLLLLVPACSSAPWGAPRRAAPRRGRGRGRGGRFGRGDGGRTRHCHGAKTPSLQSATECMKYKGHWRGKHKYFNSFQLQ